MDHENLANQDLKEIHANPTLDEVWDLCVREFLYDQEKFISQIVALFDKIGITKESRIADLSAGGAFHRSI